jgi:hypothetical protein
MSNKNELTHVNCPWPDTHANQKMQSVSTANGFPRNADTVKIKNVPFKLPTEHAFASLVFPDHQHFLIDFVLNANQPNNVKMIKWDPQFPDQTEIVENHGVSGGGPYLQYGSKRMLICMNGKKSTMVQLSPTTLETEKESNWTYTGIAKAMSFLKYGKTPVAFLVSNSNDDQDNTSEICLFNPVSEGEPFQLINRQIFDGRISSRVPVDEKDHIFFVIDNELVRMRFNEETNEFEYDRKNPEDESSFRFKYEGSPSGTSPTLLGDRVLFNNNGTSTNESDLLLYSLDKNDFTKPVYTASPFPRNREDESSAFTQTSVNAYEIGADKGGYVIVYSWLADENIANDSRTGLAKVDVKPDGSLSIAWKDTTPGDKRVGALAPNSDMMVYPYRNADNIQRARAVQISQPNQQSGDSIPEPKLLWDIKISDKPLRTSLGLLTAGDGYFVASSYNSVAFIYEPTKK